MKFTPALSALLFASLLLAAQTSEGKRAKASKKPASSAPASQSATTSPSPSPTPAPADAQPAAKVIHYGEKDVIKLNTKLRYTTLIVLPQSEQILDFTCGDKEYWIVNGNQNFAYVKPAKTGAMTNLNLITASGNIYSFILVEVSEIQGAEPDYKVFVEPKEQSMIMAADKSPRFVSAREIDNYRKQVDLANEETRKVKEAAQVAIDGQVGKFLSAVGFSYRFDPDKKPFHIKAIFHDGKFTYIQGQPDETPTLYEIRDGNPNLVNFEYRNGMYIAEKVIDRGYLAIGKYRLLFVRREKP
jgi:type IV secretory pathway VirB9-like protein